MKKLSYSMVVFIISTIITYIGLKIYYIIGNYNNMIDWQFVFAILWGGILHIFFDAFDRLKEEIF